MIKETIIGPESWNIIYGYGFQKIGIPKIWISHFAVFCLGMVLGFAPFGPILKEIFHIYLFS